jgi:hypothetical protein
VLKAGRQELVYDNSRIFGNVDWAQQGRSHDAALLKWFFKDDLSLHVGLAFNQDSERIRETFYSLDNYKTLQYIWIAKSWEGLRTSFLFLNNGVQHSAVSTTFSQTIGGRVVYSTDSRTLSGAAYIQSGKDPQNRSLAAHYLSLQYEQPITGEISFTGGFELLSGTDQADILNPGYGRNNSFNPLYGTHHAFNGHMDYFYVGSHINNVGLRDVYTGIDYTPGSWSAGTRIHLFSSDALLTDPLNQDETMPRYLGTEIDLYLGYRLFDNAAVRMGYSQMFASGSMELLKGGSKGEINNWAWVMLVVTPEFLNPKR